LTEEESEAVETNDSSDTAATRVADSKLEAPEEGEAEDKERNDEAGTDAALLVGRNVVALCALAVLCAELEAV
jgi:hypothetical protein